MVAVIVVMPTDNPRITHGPSELEPAARRVTFGAYLFTYRPTHLPTCLLAARRMTFGAAALHSTRRPARYSLVPHALPVAGDLKPSVTFNLRFHAPLPFTCCAVLCTTCRWAASWWTTSVCLASSVTTFALCPVGCSKRSQDLRGRSTMARQVDGTSQATTSPCSSQGGHGPRTRSAIHRLRQPFA